MRGFLWVPRYYNFAWVSYTFGGVDPLLTLPYFAHWGLILLKSGFVFVCKVCNNYWNDQLSSVLAALLLYGQYANNLIWP